MSVDHLTREVHPRLMGYVVIVAPSQPPAFEIQSILLNDSASLRFDEHQALEPDRSQNKDWYLHLCPVWRKKIKEFSQASRRYFTFYHVRQPGLLDRPVESSQKTPTSPQSKRIDYFSQKPKGPRPSPIHPASNQAAHQKNLWPQHQLGPQALTR